jgi:tRNA threonylcarbamoyladenosine biosynthesis protein TsaB
LPEHAVSAAAARLLLLETSSRRGLVAVAAGTELRGVRRLDEARRNARDLAPAVAELLGEQGWKARQLDGVIVGRGPGSYTGLRVGLMSARALAYATGCALVGIDTFATIARQVPAECSRVDVLTDAQQDRVYVQSFERGDEGWRPAGELAIRPIEEWLKARDSSAWVSGPGLVKWRERLPAEVICAPQATWEPGVESLLALGLARFAAGERDDPFALEPLYLRSSSAEEQWRGRHGS